MPESQKGSSSSKEFSLFLNVISRLFDSEISHRGCLLKMFIFLILSSYISELHSMLQPLGGTWRLQRSDINSLTISLSIYLFTYFSAYLSLIMRLFVCQPTGLSGLLNLSLELLSECINICTLVYVQCTYNKTFSYVTSFSRASLSDT
jgi:hypothetical protein